MVKTKRPNYQKIVKNVGDSLYKIEIRNHSDYTYRKVNMGKNSMSVPRTRLIVNSHLIKDMSIQDINEVVVRILENCFIYRMPLRSLRNYERNRISKWNKTC